MENIKELYEVRFSAQEKIAKEKVWKIICEDFFQAYIKPTDTVLEIACGYGEFSNNINAQKKIAVDLNPDSPKYLNKDVQFFLSPADKLTMLADNQIDVCFTSNFFEHLLDKKSMDLVLSEILRVLKPGGRLIAMQPNIRYCYNVYWDFYDHHLPLSHLSAAEGFEKNGFSVESLISRFVPFSTKSSLPKWPFLVRLYLKIPWIWNLFGQQFVIVGKKHL